MTPDDADLGTGMPLLANDPLNTKHDEAETAELRIEGMTCAACVQVCPAAVYPAFAAC